MKGNKKIIMLALLLLISGCSMLQTSYNDGVVINSGVREEYYSDF